MRDFEYLVPTDLDAVTMLLKKYGAGGVASMVKAGGVDLLDLMKEGIAAPDNLINVLALKELAAIADDRAEGLTVGPLATLDAVASSPTVVKRYPLLAKAVGEAATPQIRNVATIGGNLCQRPRCWYFRSIDFPCLKKGGNTCFAVEGDNRYHAIFGDGPCHIVSPSSAGLALVALGAAIETASAQGGRVLTAEQFFAMPDADVTRENTLRPGEIISKIRVLPPAQGTVVAHVKVREKESHDWPVAEVAVVLVKDAGGMVTSARIVLGAVAPMPWRAAAGEKALAGKRVDAKSAEAAAAAAVQGAKPMSANAYKVALTREVVKRAILKAS